MRFYITFTKKLSIITIKRFLIFYTSPGSNSLINLNRLLIKKIIEVLLYIHIINYHIQKKNPNQYIVEQNLLREAFSSNLLIIVSSSHSKDKPSNWLISQDLIASFLSISSLSLKIIFVRNVVIIFIFRDFARAISANYNIKMTHHFSSTMLSGFFFFSRFFFFFLKSDLI